MPLEPDIIERIGGDFGPNASDAIRLLGGSGYNGRVARCIVVAAHGDLGALQHLVSVAEQDVRDAIVAGEYDETGQRVRDLACSFLIDSPAKFWITEPARMLHGRGYKLSRLESRPAKAGPFVYSADEGEGVAVFEGPLEQVILTKEDRRWTLAGDREELAPYHLDRPYDDVAAFMDQVSSYLLARRHPPGQ